MEPKPGRLVRAIYDFPTDDASELPLLVGDIVQVKERIDKQWCRGCCNNIEGNFPIGFTIEVKIPDLNDQQQLFGVTNDFIAQEDGDLTLQKGDLVVGNQQIDKNWWKGEIDGRHGIFPLTHVWKIDKSSLPETTKRKKMSLKARVKLNMTAQLPDEMDLYKDEIVTIMEEVDKGWYRGECNGRQGIFPASFVTVLQDDNSHLSVTNDLPNCNATYTNTEENDNQYGYDCLNSGITPYGQTIYPFKAEYANELSFNGGEIVKLIQHIDDNWIEGELDGKTGIFPANFINIIVDCPSDEKKPASNKETSNETDMDLFPVDTYGRVICDFYPQLEGDVRLREGDTVTLIRKIDLNWYEVVTDNGETGVCPESYIEVIGSGPPSYSEVMGSTFNGHFNSSVDSECSLIDPSKSASIQPSKPTFISSSDSSFSSQKSNCDNSSVMNSKDVIFGLDSSLFNSSENSFSSPGTKSSSFTSDSFSDRSSSFNNWLSPFPNTQENRNSFSDWESPVSLNAKNNETLSGFDQKSQLGRKAPDRPPPPSNVPTFQVSSANNSSNSSVNSARMSLTSVSSHGSSDDFTENWDQTQIRSQIQQKEQLLKQRIACKNKLESECKQSYNTYVSKELQKQVSDLNDDIAHLKSEIEALQTNLKSQASENINDRNSLHERNLREEEVQRKRELEQKRRDQERINKMKEQRECIITEILQTERDYLSDLKLMYDTFMNNPTEAKDKGIDIMTIFGNLDEVIDVAGRLLRRLQKVSNDTQMIGECFVDMSDEMKEVYGHYCRNHDEVNAVLDKIDAQSSAGLYIKHKLEILKRQTNCFDLPSMLIKPVQRILKYPLLLNELLKCTQDGHPDKEWLIQAIKLMTDVASAINEFKRKQDLIFKYRKQADTSLSGRISKFNLHSVAKKSSRFGMRFYSSLGLKTMTKDEAFDKVVTRFTTLEKSLKIYQKDLCEYTKIL